MAMVITVTNSLTGSGHTGSEENRGYFSSGIANRRRVDAASIVPLEWVLKPVTFQWPRPTFPLYSRQLTICFPHTRQASLFKACVSV